MKVPYYTTTTYPGARLVLDNQGLPVYQGLTDATFTVRIMYHAITTVIANDVFLQLF